jgi:hypothetical protein
LADDFEKRKRAVLAPIFFEAGAALYDCQSFEYTIAYLLYLFSRLGAVGLDPERCAAILDDEEKKTAGQLIQMLKKYIDVSDGLENGLAKALGARNRLIHRFLVDNSERMADVGEHESLLKELRSLRSTVQRGQKQLDPFVRALAESIDGATFDVWTSEVKDKFLRDTREH